MTDNDLDFFFAYGIVESRVEPSIFDENKFRYQSHSCKKLTTFGSLQAS